MAVAALAIGKPTARPVHVTFAEAAEAHLDAVYRYLRQLTGDTHLAEDLTSETFERALRMWERYDPSRGPVLAWLVTIARRIALDHFRSDSRRRSREARVAAREAHTALPPSEPGELPAELAAALRTLSDAEREVVALRVLLDLDGSEASAVLGISPTACSTQLHRAMTKLRKELSG